MRLLLSPLISDGTLGLGLPVWGFVGIPVISAVFFVLAGFGIFTVGSVLSLSQPDKFIDYISFVRIQVTQVDDSVMVSTAKEFGAATTFLACAANASLLRSSNHIGSTDFHPWSTTSPCIQW